MNMECRNLAVTAALGIALAAGIPLTGCDSAKTGAQGSAPAQQERSQELEQTSAESDTVDKSGLEDAIAKVESTTLDGLMLGTGMRLSNAYDNAVGVMNDEDAKQTEVDSAQRHLISAFDAAKMESESHTDEFTVVDAYAEPVNSYGYFDIIVVVQNNTDSAKEFQGVDIAELDASGNIINSYMSYNKNAVDTVVDPGQQLSVSLTCAAEDGIAGVRVTKYEYGPFGSQTEGRFSEAFTKMF